MFKKIFHTIGQKFSRIGSGAGVLPRTQSQFLFTSLLVIIGLTLILFWPSYGLNGLFIKNLFFPIAASIMLVGIAITSLRDGSFLLIEKRTAIVVFGCLALLLVSSLIAPASRSSLFGNLGETPSFFLILGLIIVAYIAAISIKKFSQMLGIVIVVAGVYAVAFLHVILRIFFGPGFLSFGFLNTLTTSLVGSWKDFATLSLLVVVFSVVCLEIGRFARTAKWITLALGIIGIIGLFLTNITWVWVVAGAIMIIMSVYLFSLAYWDRSKSSYEKGRIIPWYSLAVFIVVIVGMLFGGIVTNTISKVRPIYYQEIYPSLTSTVRAGFSSLKQHPLSGVGLASFDAAWNQSKPVSISGTEVGTNEFSSGSSFITTVMATSGILGLIAFIGLIILLIHRFVVVIRRGFDDPSERFAAILAIIGTLLLTVVAAIDYPGVGLLVIWVVFVGSLWALSTDESYRVSFIDDPRTSFFGILAVIVLILAGSMLTYLSVRKTASAFAYSASLKSFAVNDATTGNAQLIRANNLWFTDFYNRALAGQVLSQAANLSPDQSGSNDALNRQVQQILSAGLSYANAATRLDPSNYRNWIALGNVYQFFGSLKVDGAGERARDAYNKAVVASPNDRTLDLLFANLTAAEGDTAKARDLVNQSIAKFATADAYVWLYRADMSAKQYSDAENHLMTAAGLSPNDPTLFSELGALYFTQGKYDSAAGAFTRSLAVNRSQPVVFAFLGVSLERSGKQSDADQVFAFLRQQLPGQADKFIDAARKQSATLTQPTDLPEISDVSEKSTTPAKP